MEEEEERERNDPLPSAEEGKKMKGRQKEAVTPCGWQAGEDVKHVASQSMSWRE